LAWKPDLRQLGLPRSLPALVLATGLMASVAAGLQVERMARAKDQERFNQAVAEAHVTVSSRLQTYLAALRAGAALFAANGGEVNRGEFRAFAERLDLPQVYPGIQGLGFSARLPAVSGPETEALLQGLGVPEVRVRPAERRPEAHAIVFLEPMDRRNATAIGFDMYSNPIRRAAMARARDLGVSAMSGKVELVQEIDRDKQAGFLIYHPVYRGGGVPRTVDERRAALRGFVYAPFRADDLLEGILGAREASRVRLAIYDDAVAPENLLHGPKPGRATLMSSRFSTVRPLEIAGRRWMIDYRSTHALEAGSSRGLALVTFLGGLLATVLVAAATSRQVTARLQAESEVEARRAAEEARELLVAELNHRVKNTLATVQSIASQSLREGRSAAEARETFEARLIALSHAHDLLTRENWRGAELSEIVREETLPYAERVAAEGPQVRLPPGTALALAMALHELATNAAKYGALSTPEGRVSIVWKLPSGRLDLTWRESGGPPVTAPAARGFGTRMITQGLSRQLRGTVDLAFKPGGVVCCIEIPLAAEAAPLAAE
jgi:CHASE1-domain containing sensor protein/two-component sensor histidine kinase